MSPPHQISSETKLHCDYKPPQPVPDLPDSDFGSDGWAFESSGHTENQALGVTSSTVLVVARSVGGGCCLIVPVRTSPASCWPDARGSTRVRSWDVSCGWCSLRILSLVRVDVRPGGRLGSREDRRTSRQLSRWRRTIETITLGYPSRMDAITLLRADHHAVEQLFKRFEKAGDRAHVEKRAIVDRVIEELSMHAAIEERVFYPVARATVPGTEDIALESLEEHHIVKWLLSELVDLDPSNERFDAKVTVLIENVRHHVREEKARLLPEGTQAPSAEQRSETSAQYSADAKKSAPTHPHPRSPDTPPGNSVVGTVVGVVDRVGDNLSGIAQGGVSAVQDLIARITRTPKPKVSPTGSTAAHARAKSVRRTAGVAADGAQKDGRERRVRYGEDRPCGPSGAKGTVTSAKKSIGATTTTAKRATTTTGRTAKAAAKTTATTAKRAGENRQFREGCLVALRPARARRPRFRAIRCSYGRPIHPHLRRRRREHRRRRRRSTPSS